MWGPEQANVLKRGVMIQYTPMIVTLLRLRLVKRAGLKAERHEQKRDRTERHESTVGIECSCKGV